MIPIECPKCGREGRVPPDRLNARLVCTGCQTVFHLDNTGRLVLGDPGSKNPKQAKSRAKQASVKDFDLAQTWKDIPKAVKYGVPVALLVVIGYMNMGTGQGTPGYIDRALAAGRALASNDRSRAVSYASSDGSEATGKWFDLWHGEMEKMKIAPGANVNASLYHGNPEKDGEITLLVVMAKPDPGSSPMTINLPMKREGSYWMIDGAKALTSAESDIAAANKKSK